MCGKSRSIGARGSTTRGYSLPAIGTDIARREVVVSPRSLPRKNLQSASQPLPSPCKYHHHHVYFCVERKFSSTKDRFFSCLANNALNWLPKPCEAGRCGKWRWGAFAIETQKPQAWNSREVRGKWRWGAFAIETNLLVCACRNVY